MRFFVGIDWASEAHAVCVIDHTARVRWRASVAHSAAGLAGLVQRLRRWRRRGPFAVAVERPSGLLVDTLVQAGFDVVPIHPNVVKATRPRYAAVLADPDQAGQSVLEDGLRVPAGTSQRLACDASRVVMRHEEDGRLLEVGARTRTIPPALRRALHHRDRGCRFPGCGAHFGQGYHLRHWAQGGPTTLSNLALLCRRHHRAVHEEGFQVARGPDGTLRFRRPDGRLLPDVPPPSKVLGDPAKILQARHEEEGLALHARTATPGWLGERLDARWAIDVLHPCARGERGYPTQSW